MPVTQATPRKRPKPAKNRRFERPQRGGCGLLGFPVALIRPSFVGSPMDIAASLLLCNYHHVRSAWRSTTICLDTTFSATADNERWCLHAYGRGTLRPKCRVRDDMGVPAACPTPVCAQAPAGDPSACTETSAENLSQTGIQITMHVPCEQPSSLGDVELSKG
ncbi:hypothetical protein FQJ89_20170 [Xanthomonas vasicola]|nr:hypothetical protein FQJ89_20170 [Xanthomonas vasicola]